MSPVPATPGVSHASSGGDASLDVAQFEQRVDETGQMLRAARGAIGGVIFGQQDVIEESLISLIAGGHLLLIGVPGLAKTLLVDTLGKVLGLETRRIQCTPDLMPSDILGSEVLEEAADGGRAFRFIRGPVFTQLLMADEINRASPRTQSALLQSMQERQVSVAGQTYDLPRPFHVLATQNPIEQEGTYPLPEAQLDRFLLQVDVGYPDRAAEKRVVLETTGTLDALAARVMGPEDLIRAQRLARSLPVSESVVEAVLDIVRNARPGDGAQPDIARSLSWGPGPRAGQALVLAAKARALIDGRLAPSMDDVVALAHPVLQHRIALTFAARADGVTLTQVIDKLIAPYR